MNIDELVTQLTPEQKEKARACKSVDELLELAKTEGVELTDEQLAGTSGGQEWYEECDLGYSGY